MIWHYCGFAYIFGLPTIDFLDELYSVIINDNRKMILQIYTSETDMFFSEKSEIKRGERYIFSFNPTKQPKEKNLSSGYSIREIDRYLFERLTGRIIPSFSWNNPDSFLEKGVGVCILHENNIVASSFSSAVSQTEIDIGIETDENYRNRGFASIVAFEMTKQILCRGKTPIWECDVHNLGSYRTALKVGFEITGKHAYYIKL